jgi:PPK2 family polyphosphate:nucleotide phosphotransferase
MNRKDLLIESKQKLKLSKFPTRLNDQKTGKKRLKKKLKKAIKAISKLQNKLFAENRQSLLILFQGMDSSGKDSAIKHIMRGVNPQGVNVTSFKHPAGVELEHDYLWRHAQKMPEHGQIAIFNRSHYENVLISKVHPEIVVSERLPGITKLKDVDRQFWERRYGQINEFEKMNSENGTCILKIFLHLSKKEQKNRFIERLENREKYWKFSSADMKERSYWKEYQDAYEQVFKKTSTKLAPWYIIPTNNKSVARFLIATIILEALRRINPTFPSVSEEEIQLMAKAKRKLMNQ